MKVSVSEQQLLRIQSKFVYETILDEMVFRLSLLTEDGKTEPDYEWDFTKVKEDIDLAKVWVKTKEDAKEFIKTLVQKIKNLPFSVKKRILQYVLYSFVGLIGISQISDYLNPPLETAQKKEEEVTKKILEPVSIKKEETKIRNSSDSLIDHLKYEEGSITNKGEPVLVAYDIGDGAYTIGYGHAIFPGEKEGYKFLPRHNKIIPGKTRITKQNAITLLKNDIVEAESIVNKILDDWEKDGIKPNITQGMYDAMVSMAFNMGPNIKKTDFIKAIKRNDLNLAKKLILSTSERMFKKYPGLKTRRENEYKMFG